MKHITIFLLFSLCYLIASAQVQSPIIVQSGAQAWSYTDLQTALTQAPSGAYVYLPGGNLGSATLSKELHLIGAGFWTDSTNATNYTNVSSLTLTNLASGSSFEGFTGTCNSAGTGSINNLTFSRMAGVISLSFTSCSSGCPKMIASIFYFLWHKKRKSSYNIIEAKRSGFSAPGLVKKAKKGGKKIKKGVYRHF